MEMDETKKLIKMEQRTFLEKNLFENGWNLNEEIFNNIMKGLNERKSEMIFFFRDEETEECLNIFEWELHVHFINQWN